jgi:hypothetical protein
LLRKYHVTHRFVFLINFSFNWFCLLV